MKATHIVAKFTEGGTLGLKTDPPMTEEVVQYIRRQIGEGSNVQYEERDGCLLVTGAYLPPEANFFTDNAALLSEAHTAVERENKKREEAHDNLVASYAEASGLPVL